MFLQEAPAETTGYMIFGFSIIFGTLLVYLFSLANRWRNLEKDQEVLKEIDETG